MASKLKAKSPEATKPGHIKMLIFGASGVGKSWFCLDLPTPYYIDCEGGAKLKHYQDKLKAAGGVYLSVEDGALDFNFLIEQIQALATERHKYRTVVIDSISKVYETTISAESERLGDADQFGASKKPGIAAMRRLVTWIMRLDMNVVFVAHEESEWGKDAKGVRSEIGKTAAVWPKLTYELDLSIRAVKQGSSRKAIVTKSRLQGFPDRDTFDLSYEEFAVRYGKDFIEAEAEPIVLASKEQVAEIQRLLTNIKVEESTIEKWHKAAGAERFDDYNSEHAAGVIAHLTKLVSPQAK